MAGFCPLCGSILPLPDDRLDKIHCYTCSTGYTSEVYGNMKTKFTILFNNIDTNKTKDSSNSKEASGPIVKRKCPMCDNTKMSYATLQLRSADEGQTVFYTCTKCKFKESENS